MMMMMVVMLRRRHVLHLPGVGGAARRARGVATHSDIHPDRGTRTTIQLGRHCATNRHVRGSGHLLPLVHTSIFLPISDPLSGCPLRAPFPPLPFHFSLFPLSPFPLSLSSFLLPPPPPLLPPPPFRLSLSSTRRSLRYTGNDLRVVVGFAKEIENLSAHDTDDLTTDLFGSTHSPSFAATHQIPSKRHRGTRGDRFVHTCPRMETTK